jgi:glucosamine--fructose-6-phosphate aminotransferase (isomerizing)
MRSRSDEAVAIQTYTGTLLVMELLVAALADAVAAAADEARAAIELLRDTIEAGVGQFERWDTFFASRSSAHLLARGPSTASAFEGALLLNETARIPAAGMSAASFRHGPVEVVDEAFASLVFAPATHTGMLDLALARDLARFGGRVLVIGHRQPEFADLEWYETPNVAEQLLPLLEIVPVQFAALRLAQSRGLVPGRFRYTPLVSRDEGTFDRTGAECE